MGAQIRERQNHHRPNRELERCLESLHLPTLQHHIEELPHAISDKAMWFFDNFRGVVANNLFSDYDPVLKVAVDKLYGGWLAALAHDNQYHDTSSGKLHVFSNPGDTSLSASGQKAWDEIDASRRDMAQGLTAILDRLRADYIEINIQKTNAKAWRDYIEVQRDVDDRSELKSEDKKKKSGKVHRKKKKK
jgi:hypothetical protein